MRRGDIITVAGSGDYGKPRPAAIVQANALDATDSVLVCRMTSIQRDTLTYRLKVEPVVETGLRATSYVMADKIFAVRRTKCGHVIGHLPNGQMLALDRIPAIVMGLAD